MFKGGKSADQNVLMVLAALRRIQREGDGSNSFAIFHSDEEKNYYIQFLGQCGEPNLYGDCVSNRNLHPEFALDSDQICRLRTLGWNPPEGDNRPNFYRWWKAVNDEDLKVIARHVMRTFVEVYGFRLYQSLDVDLELSTGYRCG